MSNLTTTLLPGQIEDLKTDAAEAARTEAFTKINAILDAYDASEDDEIGECAPEDRWRLYRDLRALTGITE